MVAVLTMQFKRQLEKGVLETNELLLQQRYEDAPWTRIRAAYRAAVQDDKHRNTESRNYKPVPRERHQIPELRLARHCLEYWQRFWANGWTASAGEFRNQECLPGKRTLLRRDAR